MSGKTYCILGGGGAFGIQTALYLLDHAEPKQVVGIGRAPLRVPAFTLGIERRPRYVYQQFHVGLETDLLLEYLDQLRPDVVVNFVAQGEGAASWKHSWRFFSTNATELVRLYEALCQRDWARNGRFVHIGTSELYGSVNSPATEKSPIVMSSPYSASKAAFDLYLLSMTRAEQKMPMNILRPSNCYCPGQQLHRLIPRAIVSGLLGLRVPLHGGGVACKSYMHARDLARAIHLVAEHAPPGCVYNVGPARPVAIYEIAERCARVLGLPLQELFEIAPERLGQDACYWLDSSAIARAVGWTPKIDLDAGLGEMLAWAKQHLNVLRDWSFEYRLRG